MDIRNTDLRALLKDKAEKEASIEQLLLEELRTIHTQLEGLEKKNNHGGDGGGWLPRFLTERAVALILAGAIALTAWVGWTNVRLALTERTTAQNADAIRRLPPAYLRDAVLDHEQRIRDLERSR